MTIAELLEAYRQAAIRHATGSRTGKPRMANKAYDEGVRLSHYFRRGGTEMQHAFLVLLDDMEPAVRLWAATHALEFAPGEGLRALRALAAGPMSLIELDAKRTLQRWEEGKLLPLP